MRTRVGIVSATGTGRKRTIPALRDSDTCVVTAVHGRDARKVRDLAEECEIKNHYSELEEFISDRQFDMVVVCSPPFLHLEQVRVLADANINCLIEKPLAHSYQDGLRIQALAQEAEIRLMIAHHLRHQNTFVAVQDAIASGQIGIPLSASLEWDFKLKREAPSSAWKLEPEQNGLTALYDAGAHCFDTAVGLFGRGHLVAASGVKDTGDRTYEAMTAVLMHGQTEVVIRASRKFGPYSNDLVVSGTLGQVRASNFFTEQSSTQVEIHGVDGISAIARTSSNPYRLEVEDFAAELRGDRPQFVGTTLEEGIHALDLLHQVDTKLMS